MLEADEAAMLEDDPCPKGKGDKCTCSEAEKKQFAAQKKKDDCQQVRELSANTELDVGRCRARIYSKNRRKLVAHLVIWKVFFLSFQSSKCPSAEIDIGRRVVYDKRRGMIPGYGGHVPGIHTCTQGSNFGNLTRKVLKQTVSSERLKKGISC